ncbi:LytTR family DNA-binding domain-containing protein [uncultured Clostridium sp.]|uniref:LytR/AlgR family response regulator transcription factor n=1 Tax=uncultured Clostridium sp. TaxID=59620 RepID=UPI0028EA6BC5|nr:LytTR family DNA-binding domain-containing protein [uncultured Clostridium sp.]
MNCIIVEDEIPAADELTHILRDFDFIHVIEVAHDGEKGLELIKSKNPDVVFLDINIPLKNGMDLAKEIKNFNNNIEIVFVTAYEKYALNAFEVAALDYILKPYDDKRILSSVNRLHKSFINKSINEQIPAVVDEVIKRIDIKTPQTNEKIPCEKCGKIVLLNIDDIYFCYAENEKVYIKAKNTIYLTSYTMNKLQRKTNLFRAHRSYLVNLNNVKELYSWFNGTYKLVMEDNENSVIPISRKNVKSLKEILDI